MKSISAARAIAVAGLSSLTIACGTGRTTPSVPAPSDTLAASDDRRPSRDNGSGAVNTITEEELDDTRVTRVEQLLMGRFPGVEVVRTNGGEFSVRIRGVKSFMGDGDPLFVIDGMPIQARGFRLVLAGLSPNDIARIDVLKDAGATASYGSQGANGVILISTKRRR